MNTRPTAAISRQKSDKELCLHFYFAVWSPKCEKVAWKFITMYVSVFTIDTLFKYILAGPKIVSL